MKIIDVIHTGAFTQYSYKNGIIKRIWKKETRWYKNNHWHKEDGAAIQNCLFCIRGSCVDIEPNNKYKRHFFLNALGFYPIEFAEETNHKICNICCDFCNQECFIR